MMCLLMDNLEDAAAQSLGSSRRSGVISIIGARSDLAHRCVHIGHGRCLMIHRWSIARRLFVANLLFMLALTAIVGTATFVDARDHAYEEAGRRMAGVAAAVADNPLVLQAAGTPDPSALLQPYALEVMADAGADFITIMAPDRTRWTHPGTRNWAGPTSVRSMPPCRARSSPRSPPGRWGPRCGRSPRSRMRAGTVRALVAAGVTVRTVDVAVSGRLPALLADRGCPARGRIAGVLAAGPLPAPGDPGLGPGAAGPALRLLRIGAAFGPRRALS